MFGGCSEKIYKIHSAKVQLNLSRMNLVDQSIHQRSVSIHLPTLRTKLNRWVRTRGFPLGPLLADAFMRSTEETLERAGKMPSFYKRYVENTLTIMPDTTSAANFVRVLNNCHTSVKFTMQTEVNGLLRFLGMQLPNRVPQIETKVYIKPTKTSFLFHYQSHVDMRYKRELLRTMLDRTYRLSSC